MNTNDTSLLLLDLFAWVWIGLGVLSGAILGLFFHRADFLGGYTAWPRRLVRLGHIAFFGTGFLCLALAGTLARHDLGDAWEALACRGMLIGAIGMPFCCALAAWHRQLVVLFALPVACIGSAAVIVWVRLAVVLSNGGAL